MTSVRGYVLAGGRSRRMGRDKALLPWGAGTLLDHALARVREAFGEARVLGGDGGRYPGTPDLADAWPGAGPLGALATALRHAGGEAVVLLAVDLPHVTADVLRRLAARLPGHDAVVPQSAHGPEPLCAAYAPACLEPVTRRLLEGERRMTAFWPDVRVLEVTPAELAAGEDGTVLFRNVNTPADYAAARQVVDPQRPG